MAQLRDRLKVLTRPDEVDAFVGGHAACAIFKAGSCHKTEEVFRAVQEQLGPREDLPVALIRVLEARPASNRVAEITGIQHESPQLILFKDGKAVFDRDNWDIEAEAIAAALEADFAPAV